MYLNRIGHIAATDETLDTDVRALEIVHLASGSYLYAASGQDGGVVSYRLNADGSLAGITDQQYFSSSLADAAGGFAQALVIDGSLQLAFGGVGDSLLLGYQLTAQGGIADLAQTTGTSPAPGYITDAAVVTVGGSQVMYLADAGQGQILRLSRRCPGQFQPAGNHRAGPGQRRGCADFA